LPRGGQAATHRSLRTFNGFGDLGMTQVASEATAIMRVDIEKHDGVTARHR
jgi:hypothetical protein